MWKESFELTSGDFPSTFHLPPSTSRQACPLHRKLLRIEQLSGTTSSQNILESTFSVETQKNWGVGSGLVGD
ncbi:MAG: hypothetical protein EBT30_08270 [Verrucomicrobia bacterium]|nr:hypothetical protein [Verrucomicrobiota bacterium]